MSRELSLSLSSRSNRSPSVSTFHKVFFFLSFLFTREEGGRRYARKIAFPQGHNRSLSLSPLLLLHSTAMKEKERKGPTFRPDSSLWAGEIPLGSLNENEEWPSSLFRGRTRQQLQERYPPPRFCTTHNWAMGEAVRERPTIEVTLEGRTDGLRLHVWKSRFDLPRMENAG